jgi:hypothetical protein
MRVRNPRVPIPMGKIAILIAQCGYIAFGAAKFFLLDVFSKIYMYRFIIVFQSSST